ncbi:CerR family C-terminal domain-containing protein [Variovorax sp. Varisp41]|jgi:AcrR family transcriptional regulator|uniref:CerR family C-terminal domain-containing protein n=1 Tax=unclassified Variovorax TaxID=663243 RepID=UPI000C366149|nr:MULTISPECIES: CerR family C-terminal domain-containing protein [unclassified Variovorax]MBS81032.1 TetR family transcriptional regulator [Variovorax sp.]MCT8177931.1 CerR family C-terminal domain-containing protein [Variovorax sp. CY25R-8]
MKSTAPPSTLPAQKTAAAPRAPRSDGAEARQRLLYTALRLFAQKGFAKTSTREIVREAGVNISAISYYFGDKAGLYAATFSEPMGGNAGDFVALYAAPGLSLEESLRIFFAKMVEPFDQGEVVRQCIHLHMREMLEPTSLWAKELERDIKDPHRAIAAMLCRHLGVARADDDIHRLTFAITGLAMQLFVSQDVIEAIRPALLRTPRAVDTWARRLAGYAVALVEAEARRRAAEPVPPARAQAPRPPSRSGRKTA